MAIKFLKFFWFILIFCSLTAFLINYLTIFSIEDKNIRKKVIRNLPSVLIIGVKKCGTRALLEFLRIHPRIRAASSEVHFFDRHYHRGFEWYRAKMPATKIPDQISVEKTPSYWITSKAPERISKMNRTIKLLVIVRDPVVRAVSDYTQAISKRKDVKQFESYAFRNSSKFDLVNTFWSPIRLGMYAKFLKNWLKFFKMEQLLFVSGELLVHDPYAEMQRVQKFLQLEDRIEKHHFYFNRTKGFPCFRNHQHQIRCLGETKGRNHSQIDEYTLQRLYDFYRPFNEHFFQLIRHSFEWP